MTLAHLIPPFLAELGPGERTPCAGNPELFAAEPGMPTTRRVLFRQGLAKGLCAGCRVRTACGAHARRIGEPRGIWGGSTPEERGVRGPVVVCGTEEAWRRHLVRQESCAVCWEEHQVRQREQWEEQLAVEHAGGGSVAGYRLERQLGVPTCVGCRGARRAYYARRDAAARAGESVAAGARGEAA